MCTWASLDTNYGTFILFLSKKNLHFYTHISQQHAGGESCLSAETLRQPENIKDYSETSTGEAEENTLEYI